MRNLALELRGMGYVEDPLREMFVKPIGFGAFVHKDGELALIFRSYTTGDPFRVCGTTEADTTEKIAHFEHLAIAGRGSRRHPPFTQSSWGDWM